MMNDLSNDPIQSAIARLERQHEEDKQGENICLCYLLNTEQLVTVRICLFDLFFIFIYLFSFLKRCYQSVEEGSLFGFRLV